MRSSMLARAVLSTAVCAALTTPVVTPVARASSASVRPTGLSAVLRPDGAVRATDAAVSLDPRGYRMSLAANGAPRFLPAASADSAWSSGFGLPGTAQNPPQIEAVLVDGNSVYVGGNFSSFGDMRPNTLHNIAVWTGGRWYPLGAGTSGPVLALAVTNGVVYAGGDFTTAGTVTANGIAAWSGGSWHSLAGGMDSSGSAIVAHPIVRALAVAGGLIYAGGAFSHAGGVAANSIAAWSPTLSAWTPLGTPLSNGVTLTSSPGYQGSVWALATKDASTVVVGGNFGYAGATATNGFATWNGTAWTGYGTGLQRPNGGYAQALAVDPSGTIYVGGCFDSVSGVAAANLAALNGTTWSAVGDTAPCTDYVHQGLKSLTVVGSRLYAGGMFTAIGGVAAQHVAYYDGAAWHQAAGGVDDAVLALAPSGSSSVVAAGMFVHTGPAILDGAATFTGTTWQPFGVGLMNGPQSDGVVDALATDGTNVFAAGRFVQAAATPATSIAEWTGSAWRPLGAGLTSRSGGGATPGVVRAMLYRNGVLYVGGTFDHAGNVPAANIAAWSGGVWHALGNGVSGTVEAMTMLAGMLYVGGTLIKAGAVSVDDLARWNPGSRVWTRVGENPTYTTDFVYSDITALNAVANRYLFVGGRFDVLQGHVNGVAMQRRNLGGLLVFDTQAALSPQDSFSGYKAPGGVTGAQDCPQHAVDAIDVLSNNDVVVGGCFTTAGVGSVKMPHGAPANGVAIFHFASGGTWAPFGTGTDRHVDALTHAGSREFVAGRFAVAGRTGAHGIAAYDLSAHAWAPLGSGLGAVPTAVTSNPDPAEGQALLQRPAGLYVGGAFNQSGTHATSGFGLWTG